MMKYVTGNILESKADILVNTVNCVGVMGRGLALEFKKKYPEVFKLYKEDCSLHTLKPGHVYRYPIEESRRSVLCATTKNHWMNPSKMEWVDSILLEISNIIAVTDKSIAIPALGCNNGGLKWDKVKVSMLNIFSTLKNNIDIYIPR